MNWLPDPMHPAIVHFPIVLIVLGTVAAAVAVFWRGGHLPRLTAILLVLGALGAWAALETGESDGGLLDKGTPQFESLVDAHILWAKRTLALAVVAAAAAVSGLVLGRRPRLARAVAVVTALAAIAATYTVYQTGHRGGALVFQHGAGVAVVSSQPAALDAATQVAGDTSRARHGAEELDRD